MSARAGLGRVAWVVVCVAAAVACCALVFWAADPPTVGDGVFLCVILAVTGMTAAMLLAAVADVVFWIIDGFQRR